MVQINHPKHKVKVTVIALKNVAQCVLYLYTIMESKIENGMQEIELLAKKMI